MCNWCFLFFNIFASYPMSGVVGGWEKKGVKKLEVP